MPSAERAAALSSQVFLVEPRINEMEILIDDRAVRMLRTRLLEDEEIRSVVATQKIANDLERIGDMAVNISERVISLTSMEITQTPAEMGPMSAAVRGMLSRSLGALIFRNVVLAGDVLEADDVVNRYRDRIFEHLLARMSQEPSEIAPQMQFVLASRYLERIADHATNIAEDIIFWLRGLDVRHGRTRITVEERNYPGRKTWLRSASCHHPTPGRRSPGVGPPSFLCTKLASHPSGRGNHTGRREHHDTEHDFAAAAPLLTVPSACRTEAYATDRLDEPRPWRRRDDSWLGGQLSRRLPKKT